MSNYPPGCSASTYGAPWNDAEIEHEIEFSVSFEDSFVINGPASTDMKEDAKIDRIKEIKKIIKDFIDEKFETDCEIE